MEHQIRRIYLKGTAHLVALCKQANIQTSLVYTIMYGMLLTLVKDLKKPGFHQTQSFTDLLELAM